jgi:hypothetical protein
MFSTFFFYCMFWLYNNGEFTVKEVNLFNSLKEETHVFYAGRGIDFYVF